MDMLIHVSIHVNISRLVCIRVNRYMSLANDYCYASYVSMNECKDYIIIILCYYFYFTLLI